MTTTIDLPPELARRPRPIPQMVPKATHNRLLAALPAADFERLEPHLERVVLQLGELLYTPDKPQNYAYFPVTAIVSLHFVMASGASAQAAGVGNEGLVGLALVLGGDTSPNSAMVQTAGFAYRMERHRFQEEFARPSTGIGTVPGFSPFQRLTMLYTQAFLTQIFQTAACNRLHSVEQQLCRWLLTTLDRLPSGDFVMTQELIASMLGVRREGISEITCRLQLAGIVRNRRGHIAILSRAGLEERTCECYGVVKKEVERLLSDVPLRLLPAAQSEQRTRPTPAVGSVVRYTVPG